MAHVPGAPRIEPIIPYPFFRRDDLGHGDLLVFADAVRAERDKLGKDTPEAPAGQ